MSKILNNERKFREENEVISMDLGKTMDVVQMIKEEYSTTEFVLGNLEMYATNIQMATVEQKITHFMDKKEIKSIFSKQNG
jgi:hypothetical protein